MLDALLTRYEQAQAILQGVLSNQVVRNDAVFPHWIIGSDGAKSDCFWYISETNEGKEFRFVDASAASNIPAFDHRMLADFLARMTNESVDFQNLPLSNVNVCVSPRVIDFQAFSRGWSFDTEQKRLQEIDVNERVVDQNTELCSPDNKKSAFVRDHNLWIRNQLSGEEHALTQDGTADNVYATALYSPTIQAIWSPDSKHLFTHQLDLRQVASTPLIHHMPQSSPEGQQQFRPELSEHTMAYPGDEHRETYRLLSIDVDTAKEQAAHYEQLPVQFAAGRGFFSTDKLGWWANDSRHAFFVELTRGAKSVRVVDFDTQTGNTRILLEETSDTFIKLSHDIFECPILLPLPDSEELIWFSERSGWAHLYLYDMKTGKLKHPITEGQWLVRNVLHLDSERREILVQTAGRDENVSPYYRDLCRVNIDSGELTPLASGNYEHLVYSPNSFSVRVREGLGIDGANVHGVSPNGHYVVTTRSRVDTAPVSVLMDRKGKEILTLEIADTSGLPTDWNWPEPVKLIAADGVTDIYGVVYRPPNFDSDQYYPVLDFSCGHPGFTYVPQGSFINGPVFDDPYLSGAAYAALGFIVVALEGRGMPFRNKAFRDYCYGRSAAANAFEDRISGLRQLAKLHPYMDLNRVGLVGCDGITSPVYGLLEHPDFYTVGVAVAFQDARLGSAMLYEQFENVSLDTQKTKAPNLYAEDKVQALRGKLLLIHGMLDADMPPAATFRLIDALQNANKDFDMLLLTNDGHEISSYALRRTWDYLVTHLQGLEPPAFRLTTGLELAESAAAESV